MVCYVLGLTSHIRSNPDVHSRTWLKPEQVERMKDACLTEEFPTYL